MTTDLGTLAVLAPLLLLLIGLGFTVWVDPYIGRERRRIMLLIVVLSLSLIAQNMLEYRYAVMQPRRDLRTVLTIYGYSSYMIKRRSSGPGGSWGGSTRPSIYRPCSLLSASGSTGGTIITAAPWRTPVS